MDLTPILAGGETLGVEFKRRLSKEELYPAVVCMANGPGGLILIGVDDDGSVIGVKDDHGGKVDVQRMAGLIQNGTEPALAVDGELFEHEGGLMHV